MKLIKFLIFPFFSIFVFSQSIEKATGFFNKEQYNKVIETLENESLNDYRVLFLMTSSKFKLINESTNPEEIYKIKDMAILYNEKYQNKDDSKKKGYSKIIGNILNDFKNNFPETKEQYYIQREKEIAAQKEKEKQNKIAEIQEAIDYKNYESANNLINIYKNGDIV